MKKQLLTTASFLLFGLTAIAQNNNANPSATGANWKSNGNAATTSDFIGTTNEQDLIFKTNNQERIILDKTGNLIVKDRINPGEGGGEVIINPGQLHRPLNQNPIAAFMLKVGGSGHFEGQVDMLKGVIEEFLWVKGVIKGPRLDVDSIKMDSTRGIYGHTKIVGDLIVKQNLTVDGDAVFRSKLTAEQGLTFSGTNGIKYSTNPDGSSSFKYGNANTTLGTQQICAAQPYAYVNHQFGGWMQIFNADASGNYVPNTGLLNFQTWTGGSSIDASIGGQTGSGGLLLNYFCGNDTYINTGANGGTVKLGRKVDAAQSVRIGSFGSDPIDPSVSLSIGQNNANTTALKLNIWEGTVKAIDLVNPGNQISNFTVYQNGKTEIKSYDENPLDIINPATGKSNFRVKNSGVVFSREVNVQLADYPDYVFSKNYSLMSIEEVEKYITINKHLPNVPSAKEIEANGANLGELNKIQMEKIEELTLYIIEMKKEIEALKKQVNNGK